MVGMWVCLRVYGHETMGVDMRQHMCEDGVDG